MGNFVPMNLQSPEIFPHAFDPCVDAVSLIRLSHADYTAASFLDDRILNPTKLRDILPWSNVESAVAATQLEERCAYVFHIGHVGSTLISRLIGSHPGAFSLREPAILRTFADLLPTAGGEASINSTNAMQIRLTGFLKLLSRTFEPGDRPVVKATSFVSEISDALLSRPSAARTVMLFVAPETYLETIFGGPNSRREAAILLSNRARRLARRAGIDARYLSTRSEGEAVALAWACETSALAYAARRAGSRALRMNFDRFLANPTKLLAQALEHLEIAPIESAIREIVRSPQMRQYSKAPEFAYDTALRSEVLAQARATHAVEIKLGLRWLARMTQELPAVSEAMSFASA